MALTSSQKQEIVQGFSSNKYQVVYKPVSEYKFHWRVSTNPIWDWENYEYRLLMYTDYPLTEHDIDDIYVYSYNGMLYFNDPNNEMHITYLNGIDVDRSLTTNAAIQGSLNVNGNLTFGDDSLADTTATLFGKTFINRTSTKVAGPHIRLSQSSDEDDSYLKICYSNADTPPSLIFESNPKNLVLSAKEINVKVHTATNVTVSSHLDANTINIKNWHLKEMYIPNDQLADIFYPIGCYYWSSVPTNPSTYFGGVWEQIKDTFLYANNSSDGNATTNLHGEYTHTITLDEMPTHSHHVTDPGHMHTYVDPGHVHEITDTHKHEINFSTHTHNSWCDAHNHGVTDPGHAHGHYNDDQIAYFASVKAGSSGYDASSSRGGWGRWFWTGGQYQEAIKTEIEINPQGEANVTIEKNTDSGVTIDRGYTGYSLEDEEAYSKTKIEILPIKSNVTSHTYVGGGKPHNNMPPYMKQYCWHRIG